jgi:hypothetical protein
VIRVCLVPMRQGLSWLCFLVEPAILLSVWVTLGESFKLTDVEQVF